MKAAVIIHLALVICFQGDFSKANAAHRHALDSLEVVAQKLQTLVGRMEDLEQEQEQPVVPAAPSHSPSVPIGFVYTQYPNQDTPSALFPNTAWEEITASYAGHFFRAAGDSSAPFGMSQPENSPRIVKVESKLMKATIETEKKNVDLPLGGISEYLWTGDDRTGYWDMLGTRFHTQGGEVRPKNYAVRIWKRVR